MTVEPRVLMIRADLSPEDFAAIGEHVRWAQAEARAAALREVAEKVDGIDLAVEPFSERQRGYAMAIKHVRAILTEATGASEP